MESGHSHRSDLSGALIASSWLLSGARKLIIAAAVIMAAPGAALSLDDAKWENDCTLENIFYATGNPRLSACADTDG
jgi:hypothetical protein